MEEHHRLVVLRAPIGYGKSVFLRQWATLEANQDRVVVAASCHNLPDTAASFWTGLWSTVMAALRHQLDDSQRGASPRGATTPLDLVSETLRAVDAPLSVVLDDFEALADGLIATELLDLASRCDQVRLVVAGRFTAGIEDLALTRVPVATMGEADLAFSADETALILRAVDPAVSDAEAAMVYEALGGWPLPTGGLARTLAEVPHCDLAEATDDALSMARHATAVAVGDPDLEILGPLSMIEKLDTEIVSDVIRMLPAGRGDPLGILDRGQRSGVVNPHIEDPLNPGRSTLRLSPQLRTVIRDDFIRRHRAEASQVENILAHWYAVHDAPGMAFTHAVNAQQWGFVIALLDAHATELFCLRPDAVSRALALAPPELIAPHTIVSVLRTIALELPIDPQDLSAPQRLTTAEVSALARSPHARQALESHLWLLTLFRARCLFDQAAIAHDNVRALLREALALKTRQVAGLQSLSLLHCGLLSTLGGESAVAIVEFKEAYSSAPWSAFPALAADAAGHLAMSYAMMGDLRKASIWLDREEGPSDAPNRPARRGSSASTIADALIAARSLEGGRCTKALAELEASAHDELWPFAAYVRTIHALVWGDACNALDELEEACTQTDLLSLASTHGGVANALITAARAELLMALDRGNHAKVVLDASNDIHPLLTVARARLALLTGDNDKAIALANLVPTSPSSIRRVASPIHRMETMIISSVAHHRRGMENIATDLLRRALNQADMLGCRLPIACAPHQALAEISAHSPSVQACLAAQGIASLPEIYPEKVSLVTLTDREHAVLEKLAAGMQIRDIASRSFVSPNTVKTQLQSIYRKLKATSRQQALTTATALQLLPARTLMVWPRANDIAASD